MESAPDRAVQPALKGQRSRPAMPPGRWQALGLQLWRLARWGLRAIVRARVAPVARSAEPLCVPFATGAPSPAPTPPARSRVDAARAPRPLPPKPPPLRVHRVAMRSGEIFIPISSAPDPYLLRRPEGPPQKEHPAR